MKTKIYYCLLDNQNGGQTMSTGLNTESLEELKDQLLNYISCDFPEEKPLPTDQHYSEDQLQKWEDWQNIQASSAHEIAEIWQLTIEESPTKFQETY